MPYYTLIRRNGKTRKILLGSLFDKQSRIYQVTWIIERNIGMEKNLERLSILDLIFASHSSCVKMPFSSKASTKDVSMSHQKPQFH